MALPSSGQISFGALADNRDSASRANVAMSAYAQVFASGSLVGDVDGNSTANQTADRNALNSAPYSLSEFYAAEYVNEFYDTVVAQLADGTVVTSNGYVDGESARISFNVNDATLGNSYTAGLKLASDGSIVVSATETESGTGVKTIAFTAPSRDAATDVYYPFVTTGTFENAVGSNINHYDAIGAVTITDPSDTTVAASNTTHQITHARSIGDTSSLTAYAWTFATVTAGDDGGNPSPTSATTSTPTVTYTGPGTYTANLTVYGGPSNSRNNTAASAVTHTIEYTDSITANDQSAGRNEGTGIACVASHLGLAGGMKIGYVNVSDTGTFLASDTTDSTDTRFQAAAAISKTVTPAALTTTTISCKIRAEDKAASSTYDLSDNAFNLYPYVDGEFGADDIAISVDPVLVGSNTVLSIARNITDNIVGYRWSNDGSGTMTSDNLSGGNIGGASDDSTSIIDEYSSTTTNTVSFNTAEANKTIGLILYGRNAQTSTKRTKTLNVELVDAITINNQSANFNDGDSVTISGNQSGYSGGVTFGVIVDGSTTMNVSTPNSRDDEDDSRYAINGYTGAFTLPTSLNQATHAGRVIDPNDGGAQNKNSSTWTTYPRLLASRNTINDGGVSTIYSSTNISTTAFDNDSTSYANSISYGTPGSATNNIQSHQYSADSTPSEHSFGSATSQTTTFGGGSGVDASVIITYQVTGTTKAGSGQTQSTEDDLAVLYKPCIISISHTGGTIIVNDTEVVVSAISWQGFSDATGLQLSIRNSIGGIVGSNTTVNYANTEGGTTTSVSKTGLSINLGDSSSAGTMYIRVAKINDTAAYRQFSFTVSDYTSISIYGVGAGYSTPEHALRAKLGEAGTWSTTTKYLLPGISYGDGADLYDDNEGTRFNGGTYYHGYKPGATTDYFSVNTNGDINTIYSGDAEVPPRDPSGAGNSAAQTSIAVSNYSVSNYTFAASGTTTATFDSKVTTKTVTVTWSDNSNIENGYKVYDTNSSGTLKGTAAEDATSKAITGITGNITFAVYAIGNSNGDESIHSLNASSTSYTHTNDGTLYLQATNNSGGATTNIDTATGTGSGTQTITWDKDELNPGVYTIRLRSESYTGTQVAIDSSVTVTGDFATWSAEMFTETTGNGDTDTSSEVTIDVFSAGGTVALAIVDTTGQGGEMNIIYRIKAGSGGTYTSYGNSPSVSVSAGTTTMYVMAHATQVKNANSSGTGVIKLTESTAGFDSPNVDVNWVGNIFDP